MDNKEFKKNFDEVAQQNNFKKAFGGWYQESSECLVKITLQKSSYSNSYFLNIDIFIHGLFENTYEVSKYLMKNLYGTVGKQIRDLEVLEMDNSVADILRKKQLIELFDSFVVPITKKALTMLGIKELAQQEVIYLTPAVVAALKF